MFGKPREESGEDKSVRNDATLQKEDLSTSGIEPGAANFKDDEILQKEEFSTK